MVKILLSLLPLIILCWRVQSQEPPFTQTITGKTKQIVTGKVYLIPLSIDAQYYRQNKITDSGNMCNGTFTIKRTVYDDIARPYILYFPEANEYRATNCMFLPPQQKVTLFIDTINSNRAPVIKGSKLQNEMKVNYEHFFCKLYSKAEALDARSKALVKQYGKKIPQTEIDNIDAVSEEIEKENDTLLLRYSILHPNSIVALWQLIREVEYNGYREIYEQTFNSLSNTCKEDSNGKYLAQKLKQFKFMNVGNIFPAMELNNQYNNKEKINIKSSSRNYSLIVFWFSHCKPCLAELKELRETYKTYHTDGFEIIGVSNEYTANIEHWKGAIIENGYKWQNYLDENGALSNKFGITTYPTNFLINSKGEIVAKDITVNQLTEMLKEKRLLSLNDLIDY